MVSHAICLSQEKLDLAAQTTDQNYQKRNSPRNSRKTWLSSTNDRPELWGHQQKGQARRQNNSQLFVNKPSKEEWYTDNQKQTSGEKRGHFVDGAILAHKKYASKWF